MSETRVVSLKGRIREYGPSLEHAPHIVYIGRVAKRGKNHGGWNLDRSDWANRFLAQRVGGAAKAVEQYEAWLLEPAQAWLRARIGELRGKTLGCWCTSGDCHGHSLAVFADYGFPDDAAFDLDRWIDFCGDSFASRAPRRTVETVTGAGRWAGAL